MSEGRFIGAAGYGYESSYEWRVLRVDDDNDVMELFFTNDLTTACAHAEEWLVKWAAEYPNDIIWLEGRELTPWSADMTDTETRVLVPTW